MRTINDFLQVKHSFRHIVHIVPISLFRRNFTWIQNQHKFEPKILKN